MTILIDVDILEALRDDRIVIEPFHSESLGPHSYDVHLGHNFYFGDRTAITHVDPWEEESVRKYWGRHKRVEYQVIIPPGETVLAHTEEFAGSREDIVTQLRARSSIVRSGIDVCKSAGMGDSGYVNRWTMELSNFADLSVILYPGCRIAQLVFFRLSRVPTFSYRGKYMIERDDFGSWTPEMMLPKLWKDREMFLGGGKNFKKRSANDAEVERLV